MWCNIPEDEINLNNSANSLATTTSQDQDQDQEQDQDQAKQRSNQVSAFTESSESHKNVMTLLRNGLGLNIHKHCNLQYAFLCKNQFFW